MTKEERVRHWTTTQPDCTREEALAVIAQEDADLQLHRLERLIHVVDGPHAEQHLRRIEEATRRLVDAMAAEAGEAVVKHVLI